MVLTVDIGNTNITCGIFEGDKVVGTFRMNMVFSFATHFVQKDLTEE